ncbi:MAG TPA: hypothetical protein VHE81_04710 [Lacipirellulaceae bacterium]|nr:hypothetical protein [Lacipirellulaceae bacterium]
MDCDQVFMILTRGPFPTGEAWDEQVEAHLETCAECWRLAEALRPALEVFQEAVPPAESRELPGYWGDARPAATVTGELSQASTRTALAPGVRQLQQHYRNYPREPLASEFSTDVLRVVAFGAIVISAVLAVVSLIGG